MKRQNWILLSLSASLIFGCSGEKKVENTEEETQASTATQEEWISLFDGKSFDGWHKYGGGEVGKAWKIENGELYLDAANKDGWQTGDGGDIVTDEEFENFHLKYEWKIAPNGNSGVIFLVHESDEYDYPWQTGPEMQVLDNEGHPDAEIISHRAGDLYDLIVSSEETVKPAGEWNLAEIIADNGNLQLRLNDVTIVETTMWTPEWEELIANSKFKDMPGFGKYKKGKISLQDHGDLVHFRNIVLKKL
ncbi:MAG: 3-keto-disaccharide hydrolase [Bacteroidota bacterium]